MPTISRAFLGCAFLSMTVTTIAFAQDGPANVIGNAINVKEKNRFIRTGRELAAWKTESYCSWTLAFNPAGNLLASTGERTLGRFLHVWDLFIQTGDVKKASSPQK